MPTPRFRYRPNTDDLGNYMSIVLHNEYSLEPRYAPETVVIDVGAHVGSFAIAMYARGARFIWCYEPEPGNYAALRGNVENLEPDVSTVNAAVWRSDLPAGATLRYVPSEVVERTGGGHVLSADPGAVAVPSVPFDLIIEAASEQTGRVDLVKLDCEGSEFPILLTSKKLHLVRAIVGEFHEIGGPNMDKVTTAQSHPRTIPDVARINGYDEFTIDVLGRFLSRQGFLTEALPTPGHEWIGKFWSVRK